MPLYGAVEIGGTKADVAFGTSVKDLSEPARIETTSPDQTLAEIAALLGTREIDRVGVACFGPLDLITGAMLSTPKPGWSGAPILASLKAATGREVIIDLDVTVSALGEGRWGAAVGHENFAYVTVGTGIGAGVIIGGQPIGRPNHPEAGHISVERHPADDYPGNCPFHRNCLEGMAAGPALEARYGDPSTWSSEVTDVATFYVSQLVMSLIYVGTAELVVVGGGVSKGAGFHESLQRQVTTRLADYPYFRPVDLVVPPALGDRSGLAGALVLAADH